MSELDASADPEVRPPWWDLYLFLKNAELDSAVKWSDVTRALALDPNWRKALLPDAVGELERADGRIIAALPMGFRIVAGGMFQPISAAQEPERPASDPAQPEEGRDEPPTIEIGPGAARWQVVYGHIAAKQAGEIVTWEELGELLGVEPERRRAISSPMRRAGIELAEKNRRTVLPVRGVGYKIATPGEQLERAHYHQRRAANEVDKGLRFVEAVDTDQLDEHTRRGFAAVGVILRGHAEVIGEIDGRQRRLENVVAAVAQGTQRRDEAQKVTDERLAALEARLNELTSGAQGE